MNTDLRLKIGFLDHHKIKKLQRRCGDGAVLSLIRLWCYAAANKSSGELSGMDAEDIEIAACWSHTERMLDVCGSLKLVEEIDGVFIIHDWEEHNPWAANAEARSEAARQAAEVRWAKGKKKQPLKSNAGRMHSAYLAHTNGNAPFLSFPFLSLPDHLANSSEFAECWIGWEQYRKEKKNNLTKESVKRQIKTLSSLTVEQAIETLNKSIENGWVGIFPDKVKSTSCGDDNRPQLKRL